MNGDLYTLFGQQRKDICMLAKNKKENILLLWHKRLAHANIKVIRQTLQQYNIIFDKNDLDEFVCECCLLAKSTVKPFKKRKTLRATRPLQRVDTDMGDHFLLYLSVVTYTLLFSLTNIRDIFGFTVWLKEVKFIKYMKDLEKMQN